MRLLRTLNLVLGISLVASVTAHATPHAAAQSVDEAESDADASRQRAEVASGLVDEAVEEREELELELALTISKVNEIAADLSSVGADLDRTATQLGFADVELANIESAIEIQAVDAYMTVLASPSVSVVNSPSVEKAMVVSSVVEDVVESGRAAVDTLIVKRRDLKALQQVFLEEQADFQILQDQMNAEVEHLAELYEKADARVADAVRTAQAADVEYRAALTAVDLARAKEAERQRQDERSNPTTTSSTSPVPTSTTTSTTSTSTSTVVATSAPTTTSSAPTTTTTVTTTTTTTTPTTPTQDPVDHPPNVERWRSLVAEFFPSNRVEEALRIIDCESNGDPDAYNPYSGASGLFQFIPGTWATTAPKAGYPDASPFEPEANVASAAWLTDRYQDLGLYYWTAWNCSRVLD